MRHLLGRMSSTAGMWTSVSSHCCSLVLPGVLSSFHVRVHAQIFILCIPFLKNSSFQPFRKSEILEMWGPISTRGLFVASDLTVRWSWWHLFRLGGTCAPAPSMSPPTCSPGPAFKFQVYPVACFRDSLLTLPTQHTKAAWGFPSIRPSIISSAHPDLLPSWNSLLPTWHHPTGMTPCSNLDLSQVPCALQ